MRVLTVPWLGLLLCSCAPAATAPAPAASTWLAVSQPDLLGTWELTHVNAQPVPRTISLRFRADGTVEGTVACGNRFQGAYRVLPQHILDIGGSWTERGCDELPLLTAAEKSLLLSPSSAYLSPNRRHLYVRGLQSLQFTRAD